MIHNSLLSWLGDGSPTITLRTSDEGGDGEGAKEARDLDPEGPIGDAVGLMVITNPQAMNELMAGYRAVAAYCDRIQLARFDAQDKPSGWEVRRAAAAKQEALKYFAMAAASNSPRAVSAWRSGWRVMAGLPVEVRFYEPGD